MVKTGYEYDTFSRVTAQHKTVDDNTYSSYTTFDEYNRVFQHFDGTGDTQNKREYYGIRYEYSDTGYVKRHIEARNSASADAKVYYQVHEMDAFGNASEFSQNGKKRNSEGRVFTSQNVDTLTGFLSTINVNAGVNHSTSIQANSYQFDGAGSLRKRERNVLQSSFTAQREYFQYDDENRLTHISDRTSGGYDEKVRYFDNGSISWKKGVGYYCYQAGSPHAVSGISQTTQTTSGSGASACRTNDFTYTANGSANNSIGGNRFTYTHFDKVSEITSSDNIKTTFEYDGARSRFKRETTENGTTTRTLYMGNTERIYENGTHIKTLRYLPGAIQTQYASTGITQTHYLHKDHLGSVNTITNDAG